MADSVNAQTVRHHLQDVGERLEEELGEERELHQFDGTEEEWAEQPLPDGPITVGLDGGFVRAAHQQGWFEVNDEKPRRRLWELLKSQGMQENQQVVFLSDGGDLPPVEQPFQYDNFGPFP